MKEWRVKVVRPRTHDGEWAWSLSSKEPGDKRWTSEPKMQGGPETKGKARSEIACIAEATRAKVWHVNQELHESLPKTTEVRI